METFYSVEITPNSDIIEVMLLCVARLLILKSICIDFQYRFLKQRDLKNVNTFLVLKTNLKSYLYQRLCFYDVYSITIQQ